MIKKLLIVGILSLSFIGTTQESYDIITLKNGNEFIGEITEFNFNENVSILTKDGYSFSFDAKAIKSMRKSQKNNRSNFSNAPSKSLQNRYNRNSLNPNQNYNPPPNSANGAQQNHVQGASTQLQNSGYTNPNNYTNANPAPNYQNTPQNNASVGSNQNSRSSSYQNAPQNTEYINDTRPQQGINPVNAQYGNQNYQQGSTNATYSNPQGSLSSTNGYNPNPQGIIPNNNGYNPIQNRPPVVPPGSQSTSNNNNQNPNYYPNQTFGNNPNYNAPDAQNGAAVPANNLVKKSDILTNIDGYGSAPQTVGSTAVSTPKFDCNQGYGSFCFINNTGKDVIVSLQKKQKDGYFYDYKEVSIPSGANGFFKNIRIAEYPFFVKVQNPVTTRRNDFLILGRGNATVKKCKTDYITLE